nr:hypothetical protein FVER53263_03349 [Fusarium verticillioides]
MLDFKGKLKDQSLYERILQTTSIEQVYQDIKKLQDSQAKSGRLRHLSKIEPLLARLREYSDVVETFVQAKPDILALIWGPIKLLLLWADVLKKSFDALVNTLDEIGNSLPDFCELTIIFSDNKRLEELMVLFFRDILEFYLITTKFFSMSSLRYVFEMLWPSRKDQIQVVVKHIVSHRDLISKEVRMEEIRKANELRDRELQHIVQTEENNIAQEFASHRTYISPKSYDADLYRFSEAVCDGTGKWLFRNQSFQDWLDGKEKSKPILWLRGIPGAGKTLLASSLIKHTQSLDLTHTVFAFLTYLDSHISAISILQSLIFQLASTSLSLKTIMCQSTLQHLGSDFKVASALLQTLIQSAGVVHLIVDGLDEIEPVQRSRLLKELVRLGYECGECRILFASRPESDVIRELDGKTTDLQVDKNNAGSIQIFVNKTMIEWFKERGFIPEVQDQLQCWAAPLAFHAKEIEQALLVDPDRPCKSPRVQGNVNVIQICGPIVDVVDGYIQFAHFTVREYIFSAKTQNSISLSNIALDLAIRCLVYMCQDHHDPDLTEDEIEANILWGAYRLHHFSSSFWIDLIHEYLRLSGSETIPDALIDQLRILHETRSSDVYTHSDQSKGSLHPAIIGLEDQEPSLVEMLKGYAEFQTSLSKADFQINKRELVDPEIR